jgi:hypothetical protein
MVKPIAKFKFKFEIQNKKKRKQKKKEKEKNRVWANSFELGPQPPSSAQPNPTLARATGSDVLGPPVSHYLTLAFAPFAGLWGPRASLRAYACHRCFVGPGG